MTLSLCCVCVCATLLTMVAHTTAFFSGVMIPIPQYPIYSASLDLLGGQKVGYYLDEEHNWSLNTKELERSYQQAIAQGFNVVALVLINPGNPTGSVLTKEAVQKVVQFCAKHNLVLLAVEVYQENVYDDNAEFYSCKRAAYHTALLQRDEIELASFHSTSKGVFGECGRRGGYMELCGFDGKVRDHLYKLASSSLCSTVGGQIMTSLMCRGPEPGDESYESHEAEKKAIFDSLKRRAQIVGKGLNSIPDFHVNQPREPCIAFHPYSYHKVPSPRRYGKAPHQIPRTPSRFSNIPAFVWYPPAGLDNERADMDFERPFSPRRRKWPRPWMPSRHITRSFASSTAAAVVNNLQ